MPGRITRGQRCRDAAAECRKRANLARLPEKRAEFEAFASCYDEIAEAELKRAQPYLFRCPVTGSRASGPLVEEGPDDNSDPYELVSCLACGQIHFVNLSDRQDYWRGKQELDLGR